MLTLAIRGLSLIAQEADHHRVLLNTAMRHTPVLAALTKFLDPLSVDPSKRWDPDRLGYVPVFDSAGALQFEQVAMWDLAGLTATVGNGTTPANWPSRRQVIVLGDFHPGCRVDPPPPGFGVVEIRGGTASSERLRQFTLYQRAKCPSGCKRDCATQVRFSGLDLQIISNGRIIQFQQDPMTNTDPVASISNVAPEPDPELSLAHFEHYYDVLMDSSSTRIPVGDRVTIVHASDEVYDCIPPAAAP